MEKKRANFGEEEKAELKSLVMKRKEILESKKSDMVSLMEKKKVWEEVAAEFNSYGTYPKRTTVQLRKLWENIKFRRRQELAAEKRERMKTGGGPHTPNILDDPELDSMGVDIELPDAMDSDTVAGESTTYVFVDNNELVPVVAEEVVASELGNAEDNGELSPSHFDSAGHRELQAPLEGGPNPTPEGPSRKRVRNLNDDVALRIQRNEELVQQGRELHEFKLHEHQRRIFQIDQQIEQEAVLFLLQKKKLLLQIKQLEDG